MLENWKPQLLFALQQISCMKVNNGKKREMAGAENQ